ncbi:hypothetical protein CH375_10375 [Leptospira ellisii]|uniref:Uncharacterized protein n=1 Tax=Leptospira ellisii TaxID=2023197 RepID=A0A2N0BKY2_9LEPT|nr:hypothetical protein CH379_21750 [Leptospira ellisii]PKA04528.1 hypothetical protein CH375_10375 [Leptospira ellisii]
MRVKLSWFGDERLGFSLPDTPKMNLKKGLVWQKILEKRKTVSKKDSNLLQPSKTSGIQKLDFV